MAANEIFNDLNLVLRLNQHIQGVSVTGNGARMVSPPPAGSLAKQTSFKVLTNLDSVSYSEPREDAQFEHQRSIFLSVSSCDLPFHLQGDKDFNEASAMAKRRALRFSESIKSRIEFLWKVAGSKKQAEMAQRIRQKQLEENEQGRGRRGEPSVRRAGAANEMKELLPPLEELDEEDYMALMLLIFKVLRDDFVLELAHKQIQCDWEVDSHHGKSLSFDQFFAAVFELVDVWTCDMEEATYERFVHLLARRITRRVAVFLDGAELKLSLSDNFEPEVVVKSIPLRTVPRFVSVARVVALTGISTVGELARADPQVVERERVEYLQRNSGSVVPNALGEIRKIGQDLQTLLQMFKSIALQFENINYTLDNNILRRAPTAAGPRPLGKHTTEIATGNEELVGQEHRHSAQISVNAENPSGKATKGDVRSEVSGIGEPSVRERGNNHLVKRDDEMTQGHATAVGVTIPGNYVRAAADSGRLGSLAGDNNLDVAHSSDTVRSDKRNASTIEGKNAHTQTQNQARSGSERSPSHVQQLNNFHDLQAADASIVNALRSAFLIEKAISIERQTELPAIRQEVIKFGVDIDSAKLREEAVRDRYNALYDMLVLRDGESLKTLASVMLEQIKFVLSVHGIIVEEEEDVEEVYDGFFAAVVAGTGESIVLDAQRWMEDTVQGNKVNDYLQNDFHELESIDDVKLLGTKRGDEDLLALLAKDSDDIVDEAAKNTEKTQGRKNSSPIQRKTSRVVAVPLSAVATIQEGQSIPPGPVEQHLPHSQQMEKVATAVKDNADHGPSENKKKAKRKKTGHDIVIDMSSDPPPPSDQALAAEEVRHSSGENLHEKSCTISRRPKLTISTLDSRQCTASEDTENSRFGPPVEAAENSAPDDPKLKRPAEISLHGHPSTGFEVDGAQDGKNHDTSEQHTLRDTLNIAIEFEEDASEPGAFASKVDGERSVSMEPKVPQIVIGGASSANNVPVTGRYIQLLGVGTVLITKSEREFFQLLRSHEGLQTDLVCFDIGTELDTALTKLQTIQQRVGNRVILFGGNTDEPGKTQRVALECLAHGALHFANIPFDFPRLRETIMSYFENSKQLYILRQRKPPGQTAHVGSSIGAGSLFALHDEPRKVSTSVAFAKTPRRKLAVAIPALPSLSHSQRDSIQSLPQGVSESRRADFTPIAPTTPRSSQSRNRSPRFSAALNKLIR